MDIMVLNMEHKMRFTLQQCTILKTNRIMKITNPVLQELYKRVCKQLEAKNKKQDEVRTELTKKRKSKQYRGNEINPDSANTIKERIEAKFTLMNK